MRKTVLLALFMCLFIRPGSAQGDKFKALFIFNFTKHIEWGGDYKNGVLITADTVVAIGERILEKPGDRAHAIQMLTELSGITHAVVTGVTLKTAQKTISFSDTTQVTFRRLSLPEIEYYVDNYKPFDKAGAYGIQEWIGLVGVSRINGSYFNVVGLPVEKLYRELMHL